MSLTLPTSDQPNLAPADDLLRNAQQNAADRSVEIEPDWFSDIKAQLQDEEKSTWEAQQLLWALIFLVIEGKTLLKKAKYGNGWRYPELPDRTDTPVYGFNFAGFYSENIKAKWTNSDTDIRWRPMRDTDDAIGATKGAQNVRDFLKRKLYTQDFKQTEALLAQAGKYARYYYFTDREKSYARRPRIEPQQIQLGESSYFCAECGSSGIVPAAGSDIGGLEGAVSSANGDNAGGVFRAPGSTAMASADTYSANFRSGDGGGGSGNSAAISAVGPNNVGAFAGDSAGLGAQARTPFLDSGSADMVQGEVDAASVLPKDGQVILHSPAEKTTASPLDSKAYLNEALRSNPEIEYGGYRGPLNYEPMTGMHGGVVESMQPVEQPAPPSPTCPDCGAPNIEVEQAEPFTVEAVTGYDDIETGSIVCEPVPCFELKHETTKSPQTSTYLIRNRRVRVAELEYEYPDLEIKQGKTDDRGLALEDDLKRSTIDGAGSGRTRSDAHDAPTVDFTQVWLSPCLYARKRLKKDLQTASGQTIPAGTKLADVFKKGLYMCFIEGIKGPVELRDECHKDYWVGGVLRQRAISSLGSGIEDIINSNMQLNLVYSIIYEQLRTSAMPATLFDTRLLPNGVSAYLGSLSNIPVELAALDDKRSLQDSVYQLQPQPPSAQHFAYTDKLNQHMQLASRVTDFSGGLPGVQNDTATGAEILDANSQSLFAPQLANKAEVDRRGAEIELNLFKANQFDEMYISLQGRRGEQDGIWLSAADINTDLYAEVVPDSYLPQTNRERRERWDAFLQRVGGLPGLKAALQEFPDQVEVLAEIFDVDLGGEDYTAAAELCRERIEQMKAALPMLQVMAQGMPQIQMAEDPMTGEMMAMPVDPMAEAANFLLGILECPVEPEQLGHIASIRYLRTWRTTDEGKKAPPELWAGVKGMIYQHIEGVMAEAAMMGMVGMASMPMEGQTGMDAGQESPKSGEKNKSKQAQGPPQGEPKRQATMAGVGA